MKHRLPPLLRRIYTELGPGVGPGDSGLLSLPSALLPGRLYPLCDWGSGIQSALDIVSPDAPVIRIDPNMPKNDVPMRIPAALQFDRAAEAKPACWTEAQTLADWLTAWLDGVPLFYAAYRGADAESDEEDDGDDEDDEGDAGEKA